MSLGRTMFPGFGIFFQLIIMGIFLGVIYWVVKSGKLGNETAQEILNKRLAKGEITKAEYSEIKKEIIEK